MAKSAVVRTVSDDAIKIDGISGEIIEQVHDERKSVISYDSGAREDDYIKIYTQQTARLFCLGAGYSTLLIALLSTMTTAGSSMCMMIQPNSYLKQQIAKDLGIKENTIQQALGEYVEKKFLFRIPRRDANGAVIPGKYVRGAYLVNPHLFGKGSWRDIVAIRQQIVYKPDSITVENSFEYADPAITPTQNLSD